MTDLVAVIVSRDPISRYFISSEKVVARLLRLITYTQRLRVVVASKIRKEFTLKPVGPDLIFRTTCKRILDSYDNS